MNLSLKPLRSYLLSMLLPSGYCSTRRTSDKTSEAEHSSSAAPRPGKLRPRGQLYANWSASRIVQDGKQTRLTPGGQRQLSKENASLAFDISQHCIPTLLSLLWELHPMRVFVMVTLDIFRGMFPACRGYSQALIINELQAVISSGNFSCARLARLIATDFLRMATESLIDSLANTNADIVQSSARFIMEYRQMEKRLKMDVPSLADPEIRDLFQESELFVRSFSGTSSFGLLSPLDFLRVLTLISELISHVLMLWSLTSRGTQLRLLMFSILSSILPLILSSWTPGLLYYEEQRDMKEARATAKQNRMHDLAYSDTYRPEIVLFGLGPWILQTWAKARRTTLGLGTRQTPTNGATFSTLLSHVNVSNILTALQNVPVLLTLQSSSTSLGQLALYRSSIQSLILTARQLIQTLRMGFQGIFLLGAFCATMEVRPHLQPEQCHAATYERNGDGMRLELRNVSYTYPGSRIPALKDINLIVKAGETLAVVGYNGSGKSTLAKILLRIINHGKGEMLVNGSDVRRLDPVDYHTRVAAVLQGFSKFDSSLRENVGVGFIPEVRSSDAIERALDKAGASNILCSLPDGIKTILDTDSNQSSPDPTREQVFHQGCPRHHRYGLSGGEWQRIAISRAFMRAYRPEVELLVLDEPTSSLDAHAQNHVFDTVEELSHSPSGQKSKTVIFITHRLSTARRADKIAMMENGMITEFGTHQELLSRDGSYAALYRASV